jgi:autotransporter strand-loop-strand O-heptosyltransferase
MEKFEDDIKLLKDPVTGMQFSFNYGAEIKTPKDTIGTWDVSFYNEDTGDLLYHIELAPGAYFSTPTKYYIKWKIHAVNTKTNDAFSTVFDCKDRYVRFRIAHKTLGDCIAHFSQVLAFIEKHKCKPIVFAQPWFIELFGPNYPWITMVSDESMLSEIPIYATYFIGIFFDKDAAPFWGKLPYQQHGLNRLAANILGLPNNVEPEPPILKATEEIKNKRPYVCIGYSGSKGCKLWWNPYGWTEVIKYLKHLGFDVMCIDKERVVGIPGSYQKAPPEAIDWTGPYSLQERVNQIRGAEFFIGMTSGLSWLAWACQKPVVLISGFTAPQNEFNTPYRVFNEESPCKDCWGDMTIPFWHHSWLWCPRIDVKVHELTTKIYEAPTMEERNMLLKERNGLEASKFTCTKNINPERVIKAIDSLIKQENINVPSKSLA